MAPSLMKLGAAALAAASGVVAEVKTYQLTESYDTSNFFDKFNFFQSKFNTGTLEDIDPTHGFVNYTSRHQAEDLKLIKTLDDEVFIGVDHKTKNVDGRNSVRIESKKTYEEGLFIATFSHFPKPACGAWPAFWMVGPDWPKNGEVDIYEGWNLQTKNSMTAHTKKTSSVGVCHIDSFTFSNTLKTTDCDVDALGQFNQGCSTTENNGQWGKEDGGVYALQWEKDFIKVWSWAAGSPPADVSAGKPVPANWGTPHFAVVDNSCDVEKNFNTMRLVLDITFCGDAAGNDGIWPFTTCAINSGQTCRDYVREHPDDYEDVFWKVKDIKVFKNLPVTSTTSTTAASTTSTTATSTTAASTTTTDTTTTGTTTTGTTTTGTTTTDTTTTDSTTSTTATTTSTTDDDDYCWEEPTDTTASTTASATDTTTTGTTTTDSTTSATGTTTSTASHTDTTATSATDSTTTGSTITTSASTWSQLTTSTIYATNTYTVTSCGPTVTNCPYGHVTTEIVPVTTTVCPVTTTGGSWPSGGSWPTDSASVSIPAGWTQSTVYSTTTYTITSCAPTVTNCPYGHVTTSIVPVSTTVCPIGGSNTWETLPASSAGSKPTWPAGGAAPTWGASPSHSGSWSAPAGGAPQGTGAGSWPKGAPSGTAGVKPVSSTVVTAGSAKTGASLVGALVGALLVLVF